MLVVLDRSDEIDWLSVRNLSEVHVLAADQLNTYDVVNARTIVFSQAGLDAFVGARSANTQALSAEPEVPET
ncbi:50S ribosomal protein L4, partial [Klebsiella pneumoniae]